MATLACFINLNLPGYPINILDFDKYNCSKLELVPTVRFHDHVTIYWKLDLRVQVTYSVPLSLDSSHFTVGDLQQATKISCLQMAHQI